MFVPDKICDVISFINNINKVGPMIEPWGKPGVTI